MKIKIKNGDSYVEVESDFSLDEVDNWKIDEEDCLGDTKEINLDELFMGDDYE